MGDWRAAGIFRGILHGFARLFNRNDGSGRRVWKEFVLPPPVLLQEMAQ